MQRFFFLLLILALPLAAQDFASIDQAVEAKLQAKSIPEAAIVIVRAERRRGGFTYSAATLLMPTRYRVTIAILLATAATLAPERAR